MENFVGPGSNTGLKFPQKIVILFALVSDFLPYSKQMEIKVLYSGATTIVRNLFMQKFVEWFRRFEMAICLS